MPHNLGFILHTTVLMLRVLIGLSISTVSQIKGLLMNTPKIQNLPFMQIVKDGRAYILLLPFNSPFDEVFTVLDEFKVDVQAEKDFRAQIMEKARLEQEANNAKAEAQAEASTGG